MKRLPGLEKARTTAQYGDVASVGISVVVALGIGAVGGWWVDQHFGTAPKGFLIGFAIGAAAAVRNLYLIIKKYMK